MLFLIIAFLVPFYLCLRIIKSYMKYYFFLIIIFIVLFSCKEDRDIPKILISEFENHAVDFSTIAEKIDTIPLLIGLNNPVVGQPKGIALNDSLIFVVDESNTIFKFYLQNGSFSKLNQSVGQTNKEYTDINAISLLNDRLYVLDQQSQKIIIFDLNLKYVSNIKLNFIPMDFCCIDNGFLLSRLDVSKDNTKRFVRTDYEGNILETYISASPFVGNIASLHSFTGSLDSGIFIHETASPRIYKWENNRISLAYILEFPQYTQPNMENKTIQIKDAYITDNNIICSFLFRQRQYYIIYNKKIQNGKAGYFDLNSGLPFFPMGQYENSILSIFHKEDLERLENWSPKSKDNSAQLFLFRYYF